MSDAHASMSFKERMDDFRRRQVVRKFITRMVKVTVVFVMLLLKPFRFLHGLLPARLRELQRDWTAEMMRMYVFSFGRRSYIDQTCTMLEPASYHPAVETSDEFRLTEEDIRSFYANGFLGPFTLCPREEMIAIREQIMQDIERPSRIYGFKTGRDRHLDCESVCRLIRRPALTERLAQILGPNLLMWRSQVFLKMPGAPEITWHQASTYLSEEAYKATLFPPDRNRLFQLTTWLAFDDVDLANGCMQFVPGTHRSMKTIRLGGRGSESFAKSSFKLEHDIDPKDVVTMEMQAGQFIIFSERTIHGSPPNHSDRRRWGMAFRTILPEVMCYGDVKTHNVSYLGEEYDLTNWGAMVLRGRDTAGVNRLKEPFPHLRHHHRVLELV